MFVLVLFIVATIATTPTPGKPQFADKHPIRKEERHPTVEHQTRVTEKHTPPHMLRGEHKKIRHKKHTHQNNIDQQITLVLLTRLGDAEGFPRLPILLESICKYLHPELVHSILLIVPDTDVGFFQNGIKALYRWANTETPRFHILVLSDSQLLTTDRSVYDENTPPLEKAEGGRGTNYRIQMLLKLAVAKFVQTEFYLTLDSDIVVKRNVTFEDLVIDGKRGIIQGEHLGGMTQHRSSWFESCQHVLQAPHCVKPNDAIIGVTPALMSVTISRGLMNEVEHLYTGREYQNDGWDVILFKWLNKGIDWTEYSLYWVYGCKAGLLNKLHGVSPQQLTLYDYQGFEFGSFGSWDPKVEFDPSTKSLFGVIQSINGADLHEVHTALREYLS